MDSTNEIQYSEFLAATMDMNHAIREDNIMRAFQQFDKSGSGSLSIPDLVAIMGSEEHAREVAGEIDLNGDGVISYEEFKAMMHVSVNDTGGCCDGWSIYWFVCWLNRSLMQGLNTHSARYRALQGESDHPDAELSNSAGRT